MYLLHALHALHAIYTLFYQQVAIVWCGHVAEQPTIFHRPWWAVHQVFRRAWPRTRRA